MTIAIYGSLAAIFALFIAACLTLTPTFGAPEGAHHKPSLRQRLHERNVREQARDEANLRVMQEIHAEQHMDIRTSGPAVPDETPGSGPAAGPGPAQPLMPLPPEVAQYDYLDAVPDYLDAGPREREIPAPEPPEDGWPDCGPSYRALFGHDEPAEPLDVATPEDQADQLVGDLFDRDADRWDDSLIIPAVTS